ncbi:MAG: OmpH family outer membrane protein [Methylococcales bacterium]
MNCDSSNVSFAPRLKLRSVAIGSAVFFTVLAGGCGNSASNGQAEFVVVDVISVAGALGRDDLIQKQVEHANAQLNEQLTQIKTKLEQQLKEEESRLNQSTSESGKEKIRELTTQFQMKLSQSQLLAKQKSEEYRSGLLLDFRNEILDVARDIAKTRHALSIRIANNDLLWVDPSIDVTAEVIKALRASENKPEPEATQKNQTAQSSDNSTQAETQSENSKQVKELNHLMEAIENDDQSKVSGPAGESPKVDSRTQ